MRRLKAMCLVAVLLAGSRAANADFFEGFDNPGPVDRRILFDADPIYDGIQDSEAPGQTGGDDDGNGFVNGYIVSSTNQVGGFGFGSAIPNDQSGAGGFLFHGTLSGASYVGEAWGTNTPVAVLPNTIYVLSFYLTNAVLPGFPGPAAVPIIEPFINGSSIGSAVSPVGTFAAEGWQLFTFQWNSGSATNADLSLRNLQGNGDGNDFGIDSIRLSAVPEPSSLAITACGLFGLAGWRMRRLPAGRLKQSRRLDRYNR
jgi:hypothetical protein